MDPDEPLPRYIYHEIRNKFTLIAQIDQNVNRAIQECNQIGNSMLTTLIESLRVDHEDVKNRLQGFVEVFCLPNRIAQNLEVTQMKQEVYRVLSTKPDYHLQQLMTVLEGLCKEEKEIDDNINDLMAHFDAAANANLPQDVAGNVNLPEDVAFVSESIKRQRRKQLENITALLIERENLREDDKTAVDDFLNRFRKAYDCDRMEEEGVGLDSGDSKVAEPAPTNVVADQSGGDDQSLESGNENKTLEDVIVKMYGFRPTVVKMITKSVANRKMIKKASFQPEDAGALNWETIKILRTKFEALTNKIVDVDGVKTDSQKGSTWMPMPKSAASVGEKLEILKVLKDWVFYLECNFSALVHDLHAMMSGHEAAAAKFQEFKSTLENLRSCHHGLVPIAVYKVLAMQEIPCQEGEDLDGGSVPTVEPESSWATIDKGALYERIEFDGMIDLLQDIILKLRCALITSGVPNPKTQNIDREVLISYEALQQSEEALKEIERKLLWAKSEPEEVPDPAGNGKMIKS